jgi:energy-coupling factor transporter ATP-binding protein EcfA2
MTNLEKWRHYLKDLESPDLFIDWSFYSLISAALQRRVWLYPDSMAIYPNIFTLLVGPPAAGKSRVISQVADVIKNEKLMEPNLEKNNMVPMFPCGADTTTQESLLRFMRDDCIRTFKIPDKRLGGTATKKRSHHSICFMVEELGVLFRKNSEDMVNMLNQFYDSRSYHYKSKHQGSDDITNICVTMLGGTTPSFIREAFSDKIISQGFTSRVIVVFGHAPRFFRQFPGLTDQQRQCRKDIIDTLYNLHDICGEVSLSKEAQEWHKELYESGELYSKRVNKDPRLDNYYGRKNVHLLKTAMLIHFADHKSMEISLNDMQRAFKLLTITEHKMHEAFNTVGRNPIGEITKHILRYIIDADSGVRYKKLWLKFVSEITKQELDQVLEFLVTTEQVDNNGGWFKARVTDVYDTLKF